MSGRRTRRLSDPIEDVLTLDMYQSMALSYDSACSLSSANTEHSPVNVSCPLVREKCCT